MGIPEADIERWQLRFASFGPSATLREMAETYSANKSTLGFMVADLIPGVTVAAVQAVWNWDIKRVGHGLSDIELDDLLRESLPPTCRRPLMTAAGSALYSSSHE